MRLLEMTPLQRRILMGLMAGNGLDEIEEDLKMSAGDVVRELTAAREKANAATLYQLLAMTGADLVRMEQCMNQHVNV